MGKAYPARIRSLIRSSLHTAQEGPLAWERSQLTELFNDEQIAMYINGPWGAGQHKEELNVKTEIGRASCRERV